jgi:COP9 signalosome complex subunit 1
VQRRERLEAELHGAKANLIKESIRLGHNDLGDFYYARGALQEAFKCHVRARDYCTTPRHILGMCLNVVRTACDMGNFVHVANYVSKAEQTPEATVRCACRGEGCCCCFACAQESPLFVRSSFCLPNKAARQQPTQTNDTSPPTHTNQQSDPATAAKLRAAAGLALLDQRKYKAAARSLSSVGPELGATYSDVCSAADVALYGGLAALATFDREELAARVINSASFREALELHPQVGSSGFEGCAMCVVCVRLVKPHTSFRTHITPNHPQTTTN